MYITFIIIDKYKLKIYIIGQMLIRIWDIIKSKCYDRKILSSFGLSVSILIISYIAFNCNKKKEDF